MSAHTTAHSVLWSDSTIRTTRPSFDPVLSSPLQPYTDTDVLHALNMLMDHRTGYFHPTQREDLARLVSFVWDYPMTQGEIFAIKYELMNRAEEVPPAGPCDTITWQHWMERRNNEKDMEQSQIIQATNDQATVLDEERLLEDDDELTWHWDEVCDDTGVAPPQDTLFNPLSASASEGVQSFSPVTEEDDLSTRNGSVNRDDPGDNSGDKSEDDSFHTATDGHVPSSHDDPTDSDDSDSDSQDNDSSGSSDSDSISSWPERYGSYEPDPLSDAAIESMLQACGRRFQALRYVDLRSDSEEDDEAVSPRTEYRPWLVRINRGDYEIDSNKGASEEDKGLALRQYVDETRSEKADTDSSKSAEAGSYHAQSTGGRMATEITVNEFGQAFSLAEIYRAWYFDPTGGDDPAASEAEAETSDGTEVASVGDDSIDGSADSEPNIDAYEEDRGIALRRYVQETRADEGEKTNSSTRSEDGSWLARSARLSVGHGSKVSEVGSGDSSPVWSFHESDTALNRVLPEGPFAGGPRQNQCFQFMMTGEESGEDNTSSLQDDDHAAEQDDAVFEVQYWPGQFFTTGQGREVVVRYRQAGDAAVTAQSVPSTTDRSRLKGTATGAVEPELVEVAAVVAGMGEIAPEGNDNSQPTGTIANENEEDNRHDVGGTTVAQQIVEDAGFEWEDLGLDDSEESDEEDWEFL